jgi:hypothetical protein
MNVFDYIPKNAHFYLLFFIFLHAYNCLNTDLRVVGFLISR